MKKLGITIVLVLFSIGLFTTLSSLNAPTISPLVAHDYQQQPPIPLNIWVKKMMNPVNGNTMALQVEYIKDIPLSDTISIFMGGSEVCKLRNDGVAPDIFANDSVYTGYVKQDPDAFMQQILDKEQQLFNRGYALKFTGHVGDYVSANAIIPFDVGAFDSGHLTPINPIVINEIDCEDIKKQNSLFITHLGVVEDPVRTTNVTQGLTGNPLGAWTFGKLMLNMAGGFASQANPTQAEIDHVRNFLKEWVLSIGAEYELNAKIAVKRDFQLEKHIFLPWTQLVFPNISISLLSSDNSYWENHWENITDAEDIYKLLEAAPFKLTAIVNRQDLRSNHAYLSTGAFNAGETRFVFTLINPTTGAPPLHGNSSSAGSGGSIPFLDWEGMNVILEYGNIEKTACEVRQRARDWAALSAYDLDDAADIINYNAALQQLTNTVTLRNAAPSKPNGSAINQVRTNEKLFDPVNGGSNNWVEPFWELRQYEVDNDGFLTNAPTTNVPFEDDNFAPNGFKFRSSSYSDFSNNILSWIYGFYPFTSSNTMRVKHGNHNIPNDLLQPTARLQDEIMHYFGLDFWEVGQYYANNFVNHNQQQMEDDKKIRKQLSLNTCMGCHAAETKTPFTMIRPLAYGEEANYWDPTSPSTSYGLFDSRGYAKDVMTPNGIITMEMNKSETWDDHLNAPVDNYFRDYYSSLDGTSPPNSPILFADDGRVIPNVSPFLTGRNYRDGDLMQPTWEDDEFSDPNDPDNDFSTSNLFPELLDNTTTGLFYVNDPANDVAAPQVASSSSSFGYTSFPGQHNSRDGFNDLQRRKDDLCQLANSCCHEPCEDELIMQMMQQLIFIPLPENGH